MPGSPTKRLDPARCACGGKYIRRETFKACFIESDQSRDQRIRGSGLDPRHGLLPGNAVGSGLKRDIRQPKLLDAALIAEAQINAFRAAQIRR